MKKNNNLERKVLLKKNKGLVLPMVVIIFSVVITLTVASIAAVNFDSRHSVINENQTKAYYIARSAVEATVRAIEMEINELKIIEVELLNSVAVYNEDNSKGLENYNNLLNQYENKKNYIINQVLPFDGNTVYFHTIEGMDGGNYIVNVTKAENGFNLKAEVNINGNKSYASLNMLVDIEKKDYEIQSTITEEIEDEIIETVLIPSQNPALFGDAIYSFGDLELGNNINLIGSGGRYEGKAGIKDKKIKNISKVSEKTTPLDPISLLPINITEDTRYTQIIGTPLPKTITPENNGYYGVLEISNKETYTVDTTLGDVVLKVNKLEIGNQVKFNVTGTNHFYIYIDDITIGQDDNNAGIVIKGNPNNNGLEFTSYDGKPRTTIIVNQPIADRERDKNILDIKNNSDFYGYIYAPYSTVNFKNNGGIVGSVVGGKVEIENNLTVKHESHPDYSESDGNGNKVIEVKTKKTVTTTTVNTTQFSLDVIPVSISKNWIIN